MASWELGRLKLCLPLHNQRTLHPQDTVSRLCSLSSVPASFSSSSVSCPWPCLDSGVWPWTMSSERHCSIRVRTRTPLRGMCWQEVHLFFLPPSHLKWFGSKLLFLNLVFTGTMRYPVTAASYHHCRGAHVSCGNGRALWE